MVSELKEVIMKGDSTAKTIFVFNGSGYPGWKRKMKCVLESDDLLDYAIGKKKYPNQPIQNGELVSSGQSYDTWLKEGEQWKNKDRAARRLLVYGLKDSIHADVDHFATSNEVWNHLEQVYNKRTKQEILFIKRSLANLQYDSSTTIRAHIEKFKELIEQLASAGALVPKDELVMQLLETFPSSEFGVIISILMNKKNISFEDACESLEDHVRRVITPPIVKESVMITETRKRNTTSNFLQQRKKFQPYGRGYNGRTYTNFSRNGYGRGQGSRGNQPYICDYCGRVGHGIARCFDRKEDERRSIRHHEANIAHDVVSENPARTTPNILSSNIDSMIIDSGIHHDPK